MTASDHGGRLNYGGGRERRGVVVDAATTQSWLQHGYANDRSRLAGSVVVVKRPQTQRFLIKCAAFLHKCDHCTGKRGKLVNWMSTSEFLGWGSESQLWSCWFELMCSLRD